VWHAAAHTWGRGRASGQIGDHVGAGVAGDYTTSVGAERDAGEVQAGIHQSEDCGADAFSETRPPRKKAYGGLAYRDARRIVRNLCKLLALVVCADWEEACDGAVRAL